MSYFRPNIEAMGGYTPGEQPQDQGFCKLNTNENPYPPSPRVLESIRAEVDASLRLYPDPLSRKLREKAAEVYGFSADQIIAGNGSDDILTMICRSFAGEGDAIAAPFPTYSLYRTLAEIQGVEFISVPFENLEILPDGLAHSGARVTFVASPNSPTGTLPGNGALESLAKRLDGVLVIDEAYADFAEENALALAKKYDNVIVLRTFSKSFSLAGMRIGLGFGHAALLEGLFKVRDSYNLNRLSQTAACAALGDIDWMRESAASICRTRRRLERALRELHLDVYTSHANFVWARSQDPPAQFLYEELKRRKILVRYFSQPQLDDCLRITIGTDQEIEKLLEELKSILCDS